jgi:hypothetical protein
MWTDAVRDRDVDEPVFAADGHGGLGALAREGPEAPPLPAAEDEDDHVAQTLPPLTG